MNFISRIGSPIIQLELKYCERCGGLWLRPQGVGEVYCGRCRVHLAQMSRPFWGRPGKPRLPRPQREDLQGQVEIEYLQAVTGLEARP